MIKYIILSLVIFVSGCMTTPPVVIQKFPELPKSISEQCDELDEVQGETITLSELTKTVATNYKKYHLCKTKHESFLIWYNTQKSIFESIKVD
jgi:hypothetical protein